MLLNKGDSIPKIGERESGASMSEERKIIESNHYKISRLVDMKKSLIIKELLVIIPLFVAGIVCLIVFFVSTRNMYNENFTALIVGFAFLMLTFIPIIIFNNKIRACNFSINVLQKEIELYNKGFTQKEVVQLIEQYKQSIYTRDAITSAAWIIYSGRK